MISSGPSVDDPSDSNVPSNDDTRSRFVGYFLISPIIISILSVLTLTASSVLLIGHSGFSIYLPNISYPPLYKFYFLTLFNLIILVTSGVFLSRLHPILRREKERVKLEEFGYEFRIDMMDSVFVSSGAILSWLFSIIWFFGYEILSTLIVTASLLAVVVSYFRANYIRAFLNFRVGNETVEARLIHVHKEHIDIRDREFENSKGIVQFELTEWGSRKEGLDVPECETCEVGRATDDERYATDDDRESDTDDGRKPTCIRLPGGGRELFLVAIKYDGKVTFRPMYWWVHFWPPEMFRILRSEDTHQERLPGPDQRVLQDSNALVINERWPATYDNLAYQPTEDKVSFPLRRGSVRQDLDHYTSQHNIFLPIWVDLPEADRECPDWHDTSDPPVDVRALRVVVDPPNLPVRVSKWLRLELVDDERAQDWIDRFVNRYLRE